MEENKNVNEQRNGLQGEGGRKRRNKKHKGGSAPNPQGGKQGNNPQNQQGKQQGQNQGNPRQEGQSQKQKNGNQRHERPQNGQGGQNQAQREKNPQQNGQNAQGKKNKNKHNKGQNQAPQNQPKPQSQPKPQPQPAKNGNGNVNNGNNNAGKAAKEENRKDTYLYTLDGNLYVNLTNKCSNGCDFCVRNERSSYYGNYLWLRHGDPTVANVIAAANGFGDLKRFKEVVFCGFGEPTYKVAEMVALCDFFHEKGLKTRLNTNGQGNLINKRDITPDLKDKIDFVNISLNASCVEKYQPICRSQFGEAGFAGILDFAKLCRKNGVACRFSIVDCIGEEEVAACKCLADSLHIPLYVRKYIADS